MFKALSSGYSLVLAYLVHDSLLRAAQMHAVIREACFPCWHVLHHTEAWLQEQDTDGEEKSKDR
jgi:hypothetical protein